MKNFSNFLLLILLVFACGNTEAKVFASGIKISDDTVSVYENAANIWDGNFVNGGVKIWFILNEAGGGTNSVSGKVKIYNGATQVKVINVFNLTKGVNSTVWDGYDLGGAPVPVGNYRIEISVNDGVGHSKFDSLWVAGAGYQGPDFEGGTSYAYRGNASVTTQSSNRFGNIYVVRGTSTANGMYELRADGVYQRKIGTTGNWPASTPTEASVVGNKIFALSGYGYTGAGFTKGIDLNSDAVTDSMGFGTISVRGFFAKISGTDTVFYTGRAGTGLNPAIMRKTGVNGVLDSVINLQPYLSAPTAAGYIKSVVVDDEGNFFVAYGNASASRKTIAKFTSTGTLVYRDSLDGVAFGKPSTAYFQALALDRGTDLNSASDDKIYALVYLSGSTATTVGQFYKLNMAAAGGDSLGTAPGITSAATSQIINVDPAGNVIWTNGGYMERVISFSPAGPNGFNTVAPSNVVINVINPVPVELTSFSGSVSGNKVSLTWTTATETNNSGFEVQRAKQNTTGNLIFEKISFVAGAGNSTANLSYSFTDVNLQAGNYVYRLKQVDFDGKVNYSSNVEIEVGVAGSYELSQNYPNPFNPATTINYSLPVASNISIAVYNMNGELVTTLVNGYKEAGNHTVEFNAENLPSGVYVYRLTAGSFTLTRKMNLLK